jgi:hypothetical protein
MFFAELERAQANFFLGLNQIVEPLVRAGFGTRLLFPVGALVLETEGRNSGRRSKVPLMAAFVGDLVVVSTIRRRSHWLKNLAAQPNVNYWMGGGERQARALAIGPDIEPHDVAPARVTCLAAVLRQYSATFGIGFAILMPRGTPTNQTQR